MSGQRGTHSSRRRLQALSRLPLLGVALFFCCCAPPLKQEECLRLLERYTDKQIDQARPSTKPSDRARMLIEAERLALGDPEFLACTDKVSRSQYECAMDAGTADAIERCLL